LEAILPEIDAILCSDYLKGVLTEGVLQETFQLAKRRNLQVTVAPKDSNRNKYRGADVLVPNAVELARLAGVAIDEGNWLYRAATQLFNEIAMQALLVTRGPEGMSLFERPNGEVHQADVPTAARSVYDVTGAGDTAVSVFTLSVAAGADRETAVRLANLASGIVVGKRGTASVTVQEIHERLTELRALAPKSSVEEPLLAEGLLPPDLEAARASANSAVGAKDSVPLRLAKKASERW
jgi:D-beta-D-heptose 7-phosphate kinase/D-beta-D-heptose 1-phosphate adenosyltransferase